MKTKAFGFFLLVIALVSPFQSWRNVPWWASLLLGVIGWFLMGTWEKKEVVEPEDPLFPWEEHALIEAKEKRFTCFSELYFSYRFLEDPRNIILSKAFKKLVNSNPEILEAFRNYCRFHRSGGTVGR